MNMDGPQELQKWLSAIPTPGAGPSNLDLSDPYTCRTCGKTFRDKWHLEDHGRIHDNDPQLRSSCECGATFGRTRDLKRHKANSCQYNRSRASTKKKSTSVPRYRPRSQSSRGSSRARSYAGNNISKHGQFGKRTQGHAPENWSREDRKISNCTLRSMHAKENPILTFAAEGGIEEAYILPSTEPEELLRKTQNKYPLHNEQYITPDVTGTSHGHSVGDRSYFFQTGAQTQTLHAFNQSPIAVDTEARRNKHSTGLGNSNIIPQLPALSHSSGSSRWGHDEVELPKYIDPRILMLPSYHITHGRSIDPDYSLSGPAKR